ncbi:unnamed protein product, partial [marine sediment metagenome]
LILLKKNNSNKSWLRAIRRKLSSISKYLKSLNMSMEKMSDGH